MVSDMCGRFTYRLTWREVYETYRLTVLESPGRNLQARYNICPTTTIDAVIQRDAMRELVPMRWGLVPSWWKKKARETPATFNARAETVAEKPMFRSAFIPNWLLCGTFKPKYIQFGGQSVSLGKQAKILTKSQVEAVLGYLKSTRYPKRNRINFLLSVKARLRAKEIAFLTWKMITNADGR